MKSEYKFILNPVFLFALSILLINDFYLKFFFHNELTGKLSDLAGLFVFPIFWSSLFPRQRKSIYLFTAIFFIFWKSVYSEPLISFWNSLNLFHLNRIVDYTDLIALLMLPIAYLFERKDRKITLKIHPIFPICLSAFAFLATSYKNYEDINKVYELNISKEIIMEKLNQNNKINKGIPLEYSCSNPDTVEFYMFYKQDEEVKIKMSVLDINSEKLEIVLLTIDEMSPEATKEVEKIIEEFETLIINPFR